MQSKTVLAVDLGAESGRVMAVHFDGQQLSLDTLHRFPNAAVTANGTLHWDFLRLWDEIQAGIAKGKVYHPASVGVDTWGVDFGFLDAQGNLIGNPVHYRDKRTANMMPLAFAKVSKAEIFAQTGIQFMPINTLYQLLSLVENASAQLDVADTFLMIPDLINYLLTGNKVCEFTNATTTQLYNPSAGEWSTDLMAKLGIPSALFPGIVQPGTSLGEHQGIRVIAPACHDTGSAVVAVPALAPDYAYISSGTWSLVGLEVDEPVLTEAALAANVTNEGGFGGTFRLLKNVMGLWILQQCRATWVGQGQNYSYSELVNMAGNQAPLLSLFDPNASVFLSPGDHPQHIREFCLRTGQPVPETPGAIVRSILESLALSYRDALKQVTSVAQRTVAVIHIVGGGGRNALLNQMTADATGIPVVCGPFEATAIGNALVQLMTLGEIGTLEHGREIVSNMVEVLSYVPDARSETRAIWDDAFGRYRSFSGT